MHSAHWFYNTTVHGSASTMRKSSSIDSSTRCTTQNTHHRRMRRSMNALRREPTWLPRRTGRRALHSPLHLATSTSKLCGQLTVSTMRRTSHIRGALPYKTRHSNSIERNTTALSLTTTAFRNADLVPTLARPQRLSQIAQTTSPLPWHSRGDAFANLPSGQQELGHRLISLVCQPSRRL